MLHVAGYHLVWQYHAVGHSHFVFDLDLLGDTAETLDSRPIPDFAALWDYAVLDVGSFAYYCVSQNCAVFESSSTFYVAIWPYYYILPDCTIWLDYSRLVNYTECFGRSSDIIIVQEYSLRIQIISRLPNVKPKKISEWKAVEFILLGQSREDFLLNHAKSWGNSV